MVGSVTPGYCRIDGSEPPKSAQVDSLLDPDAPDGLSRLKVTSHPIDISERLSPSNPPEVDTKDLVKFKDKKKANFMKRFIIPEGIRVLKRKLKVRSNRRIPRFDPFASECNDMANGRPNIDIKSKYHKKELRADFLLYVGVVNRPQESWLAYATYCVTGAARANPRQKDRPAAGRLRGLQRALCQIQRRGLPGPGGDLRARGAACSFFSSKTL